MLVLFEPDVLNRKILTYLKKGSFYHLTLYIYEQFNDVLYYIDWFVQFIHLFRFFLVDFQLALENAFAKLI